MVLFVVFVALPGRAEAFVDDLEGDFWLPFTHFHLGDRAEAGYSTDRARSGSRSFHVGILGWVVRDFGSAYGYAVFATRGASLGELRLSVLYEPLVDTAPSPWDAFAAGIGLELLDANFGSLGKYRYIDAYRASQNGGRCAPTSSDVVLGRTPATGVWEDVARSPAADFPSIAWQSATYVKISVGFLCAAGLTGATYALYFDDFAMETDASDRDGDGISNFEEETRVYAIRIAESTMPRELPAGGEVAIELEGPQVLGPLAAGAVELDLVHPRPTDLSVSLAITSGEGEIEYLLWDPGFHARGAAILVPHAGQYVRGSLAVEGRASSRSPGSWVYLLVDSHPYDSSVLESDGAFAFGTSTDGWSEGAHTLKVVVSEVYGSLEGGVGSASVPILVDRTPPEVRLDSPVSGSTVGGLLRIEAQAYDAFGIDSVDLLIDDFRVDSLRLEPFTFALETLDFPNGQHRIDVRARDHSGNAATRTAVVNVSNQDWVPPPPCYPACNLSSGTTSGDIPSGSSPRAPYALFLASGDRLEVVETLTVPWRPGISIDGDAIFLLLDAFRNPAMPETDGLVGTNLSADRLAFSRVRTIIVRDHGSGTGGVIGSASVRFAAITSPALADTDGDGIPEGVERSMPPLSPVIADMDGDGLSDGWESTAHVLPFVIDGEPSVRTIRTNPLDPDGDLDGLPDGAELFPLDGAASDPTVSDTDGDALSDGAERNTYGTNPTLTDTDGDTLSDGFEVLVHEMLLTIDGNDATRAVVTSPLEMDSDAEGLRDNEEWDGVARHGFLTDPSDPDTDADGLSDYQEIAGYNRGPTNPLVSDTEGDGLIDGIDLSPRELWDFPWEDEYEPGLIRFTQRYTALDVHGHFAGIYTYRVSDGECVFLSEHTETATRSSDDSEANVVETINAMFVEGGEDNLTAVMAAEVGAASSGLAEYVYGECSLLAERRYLIQYIYENHQFDVDFFNVKPMTIRDEAGEAFDHAILELPLNLSRSQSVILQIVVEPEADLGGVTQTGATRLPGFLYSLHKDRDFLATPPFYQNMAVGALIDNHTYQFSLRVPAEVALAENAIERDGEWYANLVVTPMWLTTDGSTLQKSAMNASEFAVAAAITRHQQLAELVTARLAADMDALVTALPDSLSALDTGYYTYDGFAVYVYHLGAPFDEQAPNLVDAIYIAGDSDEAVADFQSTIPWAPADTWTRDSRDGFGTVLGVFKIIRRGISLSGQLTAGLVAPLVNVPLWSSETLIVSQSTFVVTKLESIETGSPYFVIGQTVKETVTIRVPHPELPDILLTETRTIEREVQEEIVDNLEDSKVLARAKYSQIKAGLQGAAIGATVVIFGGQAVMAFQEGDVIKGTVYVAAGAVAVLSVVKSDVELARGILTGQISKTGIRVRIGVAGGLAVGGILAGYEVYIAGQANDPILRLSHYESAAAISIDTVVGVVPLYGVAAMLGWQLGLGIAVLAQGALGVVPNALTLKIVSSPGTTIVFLFEYVFATDIPSDVSEDALLRLLDALAEAVKFNNSQTPPSPTILLVPEDE